MRRAILLDECADAAPVSLSAAVEQVREQWAFGVDLKRRALRLREPHLTDDAIEERILAWLQTDE